MNFSVTPNLASEQISTHNLYELSVIDYSIITRNFRMNLSRTWTNYILMICFVDVCRDLVITVRYISSVVFVCHVLALRFVWAMRSGKNRKIKFPRVGHR